ncbi:MAG: hypothetical protein P4L98_21180 [Ancalomicrobiaceae bacterium]|nr:hypothetical protein [Ancalomicrobiaceae bacterium]
MVTLHDVFQTCWRLHLSNTEQVVQQILRQAAERGELRVRALDESDERLPLERIAHVPISKRRRILLPRHIMEMVIQVYGVRPGPQRSRPGATPEAAGGR